MSDENGKEEDISPGADSGEAPVGGGPMEENGSGNAMPLGSGRPSVSAAPGKMAFILLGAGIFLFIVIRSLFFNLGGNSEKQQHVRSSVSETKVVTPAAPPPPIQEVQIPQQPLPPPPPVLNTPPPPPSISSAQPDTEALRARVRSSMIVSGGGGGVLGKLTGSKKRPPVYGSDANAQFAQGVQDTTGADQATATSIGNLNTTIAQGKFIHAVLETAISTDLPGPIRAIVSHDIYAEAGRDVLIPKGSRMIGAYNSATRKGQGRVFIIWTRVIRPDGVDIEIDSPGIDSLGRAGLGGDVDNKYFEMFSTAILTSTLDIGMAAAGQMLFGPQQSTSTTTSTGTTTTSTPAGVAMQQGVQNLGTVGNSIVGSTLNLTPTINVDQGTPVEVFVNRDLIFPSTSHFIE